MIYDSLKCDVCNVINFARIDFYLQKMNSETNVACKTANRAFVRYVYSFGM